MNGDESSLHCVKLPIAPTHQRKELSSGGAALKDAGFPGNMEARALLSGEVPSSNYCTPVS
jgi:hypothetical protein